MQINKNRNREVRLRFLLAGDKAKAISLRVVVGTPPTREGFCVLAQSVGNCVASREPRGVSSFPLSRTQKGRRKPSFLRGGR